MKKILALGLAVAVILGFGFAAEAASHLEDGEYVGYSEADDNGYVEAVISLEDGEITAVELTEYTDLGEAKGEDYPWDEWHEAMEVLPERFIEADSADVDVVSGATGTSEKAMGAVEMALMKAEGVETFDGTYLGTSAEDNGGWGVAWVTVEGESIVDVRLEEVTDGEEFKDEDYQWDEFHEAREEMPERFIEADSPDVDAYTGATGSSEMWMEAVKSALEKAGWEF